MNKNISNNQEKHKKRICSLHGVCGRDSQAFSIHGLQSMV